MYIDEVNLVQLHFAHILELKYSKVSTVQKGTHSGNYNSSGEK